MLDAIATSHSPESLKSFDIPGSKTATVSFDFWRLQCQSFYEKRKRKRKRNSKVLLKMQDIRFSSHCIQQSISLINTLPDNTEHSKITKEDGTLPLPNILRNSERNCDVTSTCCVTSTIRCNICYFSTAYFRNLFCKLLIYIHVPDRLLRG